MDFSRQHSYRENLPLTDMMTFFSDGFQACTTQPSGWCNIPNKTRFSATEQMIVAYHKGAVEYTKDCSIEISTLTGVELYYWTL